PSIRLITPYRFVNQRFVEGHTKNGVGQLNFANFLAFQVYNFDCWHCEPPSPSRQPRDRSVYFRFAAFLTMTTLPFAPGTAPRIISKLFSASTWATVSPLIVTRTSPMCPEDRIPLTTR